MYSNSPENTAAVSKPPHPGTGERGLTLTELVIVGLLATIVMMALTAFYVSSQRVWVDGSTQAMAQRDGTLLVEALRRSVHEAELAGVSNPRPDPDHDELWLKYAPGDSTAYFRWDSTDRRVHLWVNGPMNGLQYRGPVADTPVSRFYLTVYDTTMVELTRLDLKTANGDSVSMTSRFELMGG